MSEFEYTPEELEDLAVFDERMAIMKLDDGRYITRNADTRREYAMRAYALRMTAELIKANWLRANA